MAATAGSNTKDILSEVRTFIAGTSKEKSISAENLARSALHLLQTLPVARHAVLEHLCSLFDEAVKLHILQSDDPAYQEQGESKLDVVIQDVCGVLFNFIKTNPMAWAPIISNWSLELLGHISCKYAHQCGLSPTSSLNELLQMWVTCKPTKALMEVATECFAAMVSSAPDVCVDALLEASVKYSPHFDWVVAHIGSCFPNTIITRVLMCGLKDFCQHGNKRPDMEVRGDEKVPKMNSVVDILGHLASKHRQDIRGALMKLFEESMKSDSEVVKVTTVPFLLELASRSDMLLQVLSTDLIKSLNPKLLDKLHANFEPWRKRNAPEYMSLISLVVQLIMKIDFTTLEVLEFMLEIASPVNTQCSPCSEVQEVGAIILNRLIFELQRSVFHKHRDSSYDVPFLSSLVDQSTQILRQLLESKGPRGDWLLRIAAYIGLYSGEDLASDMMVYIICNATSHVQLCRFVQLQSIVEVKLGDVLPVVVQKVTDKLRSYKIPQPNIILGNILAILEWEKSTKSLSERSTTLYWMKKQWEAFLPLLTNDDLHLVLKTVNVLNALEIPTNISSATALRLCSTLLNFFFRSLEVEDTRTCSSMFHSCRLCLKYLCKETFIQCIALRFLMESLFIKDIAILFGAKQNVPVSKDEKEKKNFQSLYESNRKQGLTTTLHRTQSTVFHAGVIGQGLRLSKSGPILPKVHVERNKQCLMSILRCCSHQTKHTEELKSPTAESAMETDEVTATPPHRLNVSGDLCRMIGSLMTELITPDVLYNNRFWPEEESIQMTVERDLQIFKNMDDNPVLWQILDMYAASPLTMCRCSPILKSLTASLMIHFESSREKSARNTPKQLEAAAHLITYLGKSRLLPAPLRYVSELFHMATSFEVYLLLLSVWRYMKEFPPTEDPDEVNTRACELRHLETIRSIMHNNVDRMGNFYGRFFSQFSTSD
uniref:Integrator complex subunit 5-like n=1 Tax=Crassostrea virginica TaxID=6565 RepID=A0A8B8DJ20_CRAVI|nr:integrator complex subunit 5-like [Crassostrea virginica]